MVIRKSKFIRGHRSSSRPSFRRNTHQRNGSFSNNQNKTKIRGNPNQVYSKYLILAKNALSSGDRIQAEYYFQHADHYSRIIVENGLKVEFVKLEENQKENNNIIQKDQPIKEEENNITEEVTKQENVSSLDSVAFLSNELTKK